MSDRTAGALRLDDAAGKWVVAAAVLGSGMALLDGTVVNIALPVLGRDLHAGFDGLQWTINGYTLTLASLILLGGSLADRFGRRLLFVVGTAWFGVASVLCALAPTIEILVAARALEGVGGALLTPGSMAMIQASFDEQDRGKAIGAWSGLSGVGAAIGPFLGGYLVAGPGWRWVFLINVPVAVAVLILAQRHVPESRDPNAAAHFDVSGVVLGAVGLGATTYALIAAGGGWSATVLVSLLVGVVALVAFVVNEERSANPMLPGDLFRNGQFTATNVFTFFVYAALGGMFFFLMVELEVVTQYSPILAGSALLPVTVIMLALSAQTGALSVRIGPRLPLAAGAFVAGCGVLLLLRVGPGASLVTDVLPGVTMFALGMTLLVAPLTTAVLAAAPAEHAGIASGVNNAVARAAGLFAVALLPLLAGISGSDYENPPAFAAGFRTTMIACATLLGLAALLAASMIRNPAAPQAPVRRRYCAIDGPPLQPALASRFESSASRNPARTRR